MLRAVHPVMAQPSHHLGARRHPLALRHVCHTAREQRHQLVDLVENRFALRARNPRGRPRVVDFETGLPISYGRAFARNLGRLLSGLVFLLGYLWMLWDRDRQTWHDKIASTTVVPVESFPVERWPG